MGSLIKGKIKVLPSGLTSVMFSHVPESVPSNGSPVAMGCGPVITHFETGEVAPAKPHKPLAVVPKFGKTENLPAGKGNLGNKQKASWKSCRQVRERMAACEMEFKKQNSWLLTVTQPSVDERAYEALARWSSYAMDRLNREFNRIFDGKRLARVSVWEYQKRGSLHCHILLSSDCIHAMDMELFRLHICKVWYRILVSISKKFECNPVLSGSGRDWTLEQLSSLRSKKNKGVFVDCQVVKRSIVAYLSKYLASSNHEDDGKQNKQSLREINYPIATWFQWNRLASELYEKYTDEFELGECEPDKKNLIIEKVKRLAEKLAPMCKKDTEVKFPKNVYNVGLYLIPCISKLRETASIIAKFVSDMSIYFREKISKVGKVFTPKSLIDYHFYGVSEDAELTVREYERERRISTQLLNVTTAKDMYNLGHLLIQLEHSLNTSSCEVKELVTPIQLVLNYGLEETWVV